ncbi:MAG TPA: hypothetical protein VMW69_01075 [Spirochaetia bacterium]|nr:hypothetical protein [Spirochaetia bacterium]
METIRFFGRLLTHPFARQPAADRGPHRVAAVILVVLSATLPSSCMSSPHLASASASAAGTAGARPIIVQSRLQLASPETLPAFAGFYRVAAEGPVIPGLLQGAVPQGLAFDPHDNLILISAYFDVSLPSVLMALNGTTGKLAKTVWLAGTDGTPLDGHVGGLAISPSFLWVASDIGVYRYKLTDFDAAADGAALLSDGLFSTDVVASFATYSDGVLWVGEFAYYGLGGGDYQTETSHHLSAPDGSAHHALVAGYRIDTPSAAIHGEVPDYLVSIPDRVQGIAFFDSDLYLSLSYGRRNESTLEAYRNPLESPPALEFASRSGKRIPLWFLDSGNRVSSTAAPPMMEGIAPVSDRLLILFESGAEKYRSTGTWPIDHMESVGSLSAGG